MLSRMDSRRTGNGKYCASMFFGGISGSSAADTASLGTILIPMMSEQGYDTDFQQMLQWLVLYREFDST